MRECFDYVIVGGGSAGAVLAARLSENPSVTVALLEAGGDGNSLLHRAPMGVVGLVPFRSPNNWGFFTAPQKELNGRRGYQPRGRGLGGSSGVNAMVYIRGNRADFDGWASRGLEGWSYEDVLPHFKRAENNERLGEPFHGQSGPLSVADQRSDIQFTKCFLDAAAEAGFRLNDDVNGASQEGMGYFQVNQINGERCSTARAYLEPIRGRCANLKIFSFAQATSVRFEERRATGVNFRRDGKDQTVSANREVILSAGVFQSPQLLMLSGIGDPTHLQSMNIPVVSKAPGVGRNLQDHIDFVFLYKCASLDLFGLSLKGTGKLIGEFGRWRRERRGWVATNFAEAGGFLASRPGLSAPDLQLHFVVAMVQNHGRSLRPGHGFSCHVCNLQPESRGTVKLASPDPLAAPVIDPRFFDNPNDLEVMVKGFKETRRILEQPALAKCAPVDVRTAGVRTDDEIRAVIRQYADSIYHPAGTCAMGLDDNAVVDADLRVTGVSGLRVVDASVMPTITRGNTHAATVMIAEKAANLLARP